MKTPRAKLIQLIHTGKRELRLDDAAYRAMLLHVAGADSCAGLDEKRLNQVVEHLRSRGFRPFGELARLSERRGMLIRKKWKRLAELGALNDPSERSLMTWIARQIYGPKATIVALGPEFLGAADSSRIIEALKGWIKRVEGKADGGGNFLPQSRSDA